MQTKNIVEEIEWYRKLSPTQKILVDKIKKKIAPYIDIIVEKIYASDYHKNRTYTETNQLSIYIENEKTGKVFQTTLINKTPNDYYNIEDDILDIFLDEMETKYNATMDFTGGKDFVKWTIYEIEDEKIFPKILKEFKEFILDPKFWYDSKKYNL